MRYSASELRRMHPDGEFRSTLARIYAIRQFFRKGLRTKAFVVPECVNESVALSEAGKCVFEKFDKMQLSSAETKFLAFILLYHDELLIDIANTNCDALYNFLKEAVDLGTLKFPWAFEHTLYDRAFELFPDRPGLLNPAQTELLLTDTPP